MDSIFIDGGKDATMTVAEPNRKFYRQTTLEEHCIVVGEPSCFCYSHVMPEDSTGGHVAWSIYNAIKEICQAKIEDN